MNGKSVFLKTNDINAAVQLSMLGFSYMKEKVNGEAFFVFKQSPELAEVILTQFADTHWIADDCLCFA